MMSAGYVWALIILSTTEGGKVSVGTSRFLGAASGRAGFPCGPRSRTPHSKKSIQTERTFARVRAERSPQ